VSNLLKLVTVATILISPIAAFSQGSAPLTRAQVYAEMVQYEKDGYNPARQNPRTWVDDAHRATSVLASKNLNAVDHVANDHTANSACNSGL
jgi:hypothetical protein